MFASEPKPHNAMASCYGRIELLSVTLMLSSEAVRKKTFTIFRKTSPFTSLERSFTRAAPIELYAPDSRGCEGTNFPPSFPFFGYCSHKAEKRSLTSIRMAAAGIVHPPKYVEKTFSYNRSVSGPQPDTHFPADARATTTSTQAPSDYVSICECVARTRGAK